MDLFNEDDTKKWEALKRFYSYQVLDFMQPREGMGLLYNNPDAFPDFELTSGKEKILVHRLFFNRCPALFPGIALSWNARSAKGNTRN